MHDYMREENIFLPLRLLLITKAYYDIHVTKIQYYKLLRLDSII